MARCSIAIAVTLLAALWLQAQPTSSFGPSRPLQAETPQTSAPTAPRPPLIEQSMTAAQLDTEGDRLRRAKDYPSALFCYRAAVRKHPTAEDYNKIAITELLLQRPADAANAANKAVHKDKHFAEAWNNLAVTYYLRDRYDIAIEIYRRAISLQPGFASFHSNLAEAYLDNGQVERALSEYRRAFELDPSFFDRPAENGVSARLSAPQDRAWYSFVMARLFASSGDLDRALRFLRSAMEEGYPRINDVYRDKEFARALTDERFVALMKDRPVSVR
jgi:tetratricopeptide (TPR) repeat protein